MFLKTEMLHVCLYCIQHVTEKEEQWLNLMMCLYYSVYSTPVKKEQKRITNIHRLLFKQTESSKTAVLFPQTPQTFNWHPKSRQFCKYSFSWKSSKLFVLALSCDRKTYQVLISTSPPFPTSPSDLILSSSFSFFPTPGSFIKCLHALHI